MKIKQVLNQIILNKDGLKMATDYFYPALEEPLPVLIYTHGFNGFKDWGNFNLIAQAMAQAGFFVVKYNLSHNGTTFENASQFIDLELYRNNNYSKELNDLQSVIHHITTKGFQYSQLVLSNKVNLLGHSRGGAISILAAQDSRISSVVTWASIAQCTSPWSKFTQEQMAEWKAQGTFYYENKRTDQQLPIDYQIYEDYLENKARFDLEKIVSNMTKPMLFIHGTEDPAVPYHSAEKLNAANITYSKLLLCTGDHVFGRKHPWPHDYLPADTKFVVEQTIKFLQLV
jgi:uncharacterized protein